MSEAETRDDCAARADGAACVIRSMAVRGTREQTFRHDRPFYDRGSLRGVADAIESHNPGQLRDELGDLFVSNCIPLENGAGARLVRFCGRVRPRFTISSCGGIRTCSPGAPVEGLEAQTRNWEELKATANARKVAGAPAGQAMPAPAGGCAEGASPRLPGPRKLGRTRRRRVGFDWQEPGQVRDKVLGRVGGSGRGAGARSHMSALPRKSAICCSAIANWTTAPENRSGRGPAGGEREVRAAVFRPDGKRWPAPAVPRFESLSAAEWDALWRKAKEA